MRGLHRAASALALLFGVAGGVAVASDSAPEWVVRAGRTSVPASLTDGPPPADSVTLWRQTTITVSSGSAVTRRLEREAVRILAQSGTESAIFSSFYDDDSKVDVEGAWSLHVDGTAETLKSRDVASAQLADPEDFSDIYRIAFRPPNLGVGDIAAYALTRKAHREVYQWRIRVQDSRPILAQQILIDLPSGWRHRWRLTRSPEGYTGAMSGEGNDHATYEFPPQRAIAEEDSAPPEADLPARFEVALVPPSGTAPGLAFDSWNDVGRWASKRFLPAYQDAPFVGLPPSPPDPLRVAAAWVQDHIRYVTIEVGEGGYVPRTPAVVVRRLYGDCKDKAFLMLALLRKYHISGFPILTRPKSTGAIDPDFPSPTAFDHAIVAIPETAPSGLPAEMHLASGPAIIFDPTDPATPFGSLRADLQGARGLVVGESSSELIQFPYSPPDKNRFSRTIEAVISGDRSLSASVSDVSEGAESRRLLYRDESDSDRDNRISRYAQRRIPGSRISQVAVRNLEDREKPLEVAFHLQVLGWAQKSGSSTVLRLLPLSIGPERIPDLDRRKYPIELGVPGHRELLVRFTLGVGLKPGHLPDAVDVDNTYAHYHFAASLEDGKIVAREQWDPKKTEIPTSAIASWQALEDASAKAWAGLATLNTD